MDTIGVTAVEGILGGRDSAEEPDNTTETPESSQKQSLRPEIPITALTDDSESSLQLTTLDVLDDSTEIPFCSKEQPKLPSTRISIQSNRKRMPTQTMISIDERNTNLLYKRWNKRNLIKKQRLGIEKARLDLDRERLDVEKEISASPAKLLAHLQGKQPEVETEGSTYYMNL